MGTRQQKRNQIRQAAKYEQRQTFSKQEIEQFNEVAYDFGASHAIQAAIDVFKLGDKRLKRLLDRLSEIEKDQFGGGELKTDGPKFRRGIR